MKKIFICLTILMTLFSVTAVHANIFDFLWNDRTTGQRWFIGLGGLGLLGYAFVAATDDDKDKNNNTSEQVNEREPSNYVEEVEETVIESESDDKIVFEAEEFIYSSDVTILNKGGASGEAIQFGGSSSGRVDYEIMVPTTGTWLVSVRTMAHDSESNGLYIYVDNKIQRASSDNRLAGTADIYLYKGNFWSEELKWQGDGGGNVEGPVTIELSEGKHTFSIRKRKMERPLIDKITLTLEDNNIEGSL